LAEISLESRFGEFETAGLLDGLCLVGALAVDQVGDEPQTAETLRATRELLALADRQLEELRYDEALESYEAVLALDRLNQLAKKGLIAVVESRHRARAKKTVPLEAIPLLKVPLESLTLAHIDPQEAFILSRINGQWDVRSILKLCPMAEDDALVAFARLATRKIVEFA
jgi:hypothetical protein